MDIELIPNTLPITNNSLASEYIKLSTANNTRKAYQADIKHFENWGGQLPANTNTVLAYINYFADKLNTRTIERRIVAIRNWHNYQKFTDPTNNPLVKKMLLGIKKVHGKPKQKAPALSLEQLEAIVIFLNNNPNLTAQNLRNNALLQIGFFGAFRRSELTAIKYEDLNWVPQGLEILIPRSKTDHFGEGNICAIPYGKKPLCPITALNNWLEYSKITQGHIFNISDKSVNNIIKTLAKIVDLPHAEKYSGHSLRRGLATSATKAGGSLLSIMKQGRWKNTNTVLGYIEEASKFAENVVDIMLK